MKYLVLHNFWSYGRYLRKGEVVDEAEIRSPRLRRSEGKIFPAVSSKTSPEGKGVAAPTSQETVTENGDHIDQPIARLHFNLAHKAK